MGTHVDNSDMVSFRTLAVPTLAAALLVAGGGAALADPPPWAHAHHGRTEGPPSGAAQPSQGEISGVIENVDYGAATITLATPRGPVVVAVRPTTSIYRGSEFATLSDLARGKRVTVDFSAADGALVAQIIRIR